MLKKKLKKLPPFNFFLYFTPQIFFGRFCSTLYGIVHYKVPLQIQLILQKNKLSYNEKIKKLCFLEDWLWP